MRAAFSRIVCATMSHFACSVAVIFRSACNLVIRASTVSPFMLVAVGFGLFWTPCAVVGASAACAIGLTSIVVPISTAMATVRRKLEERMVGELRGDMDCFLFLDFTRARIWRGTRGAQPSETTQGGGAGADRRRWRLESPSNSIS